MNKSVDPFGRDGIPENQRPRQVPYGAVGRTRRYLAFKLQIAVEDGRATLVCVAPEPVVTKGLRSWMAAHRRWRIAPCQL